MDNDEHKHSCSVVTQWYRPPELFFGKTYYSSEVDVWSAACTMYEMVCKKVLFKCSNLEEQIITIFSICGNPIESSEDLTESDEMKESKARVRDLYNSFDDYKKYKDNHYERQLEGMCEYFYKVIQ